MVRMCRLLIGFRGAYLRRLHRHASPQSQGTPKAPMKRVLSLLVPSAALCWTAAVAAIVKPQVLIVNMFINEAEAWYGIPDFNVLAKNITVPGLSPLFPQVHCTQDGRICQLVTGEGEINAASSISTLVNSPAAFDLTSTYFLISGIAGINPKVATIGSVTLARYAVHVGLQFEVDARQIPGSFSTGYFGQGTTAPGQYPTILYGTEVFELNEPLRQLAFAAAKSANLTDSADSQAMRAAYAKSAPAFAAINSAGPRVVLCDTATADAFWGGNLLGDAFANTTAVWTNGTGVYCSTQQEDNATLNSLLRGSLAGLVDFSRIIVLRAASDFDRPLAGGDSVATLLGPAPAFVLSTVNARLVGVKVIAMILNGWKGRFQTGVKATNYVGDIFGSLGGNPDFGPGSIFGGKVAP
ncbi:unnamed protein product [Mycena citricolor]|uniref:Purine nucleoside permease n=1 Tax=Mycena citricolor TaxID=2018698 RepID=A0AAD2H062_9AGAR|nr:unnamed protein product [Mycena citricolor]